MSWEDSPEIVAQKPSPEELAAVRMLAEKRGLNEPIETQTASELLGEVRLNKAKAEYEALRQLQMRTRSGGRSSKNVDRVYRPYLVIVAIALIAYVLMRVLGKG